MMLLMVVETEGVGGGSEGLKFETAEDACSEIAARFLREGG